MAVYYKWCRQNNVKSWQQQASVVINVDQLSYKNSHNANSSILETKTNEECNEISDIESPDGQMPKISGVVPTAAKATPSDRSERQLGKKERLLIIYLLEPSLCI